MNTRAFRPLFVALLGFTVISSLSFAETSPNRLTALRTQAESGNAIAQYNLGLVYADSDESSHDLVQAYVWLTRAAANGSRSRELERVADQLSSAQLRSAREQLAQIPSVSITPVDLDESAAPTPIITRTVSADPELRKRLAIAESALAVRERDLASLRTEIEQLKQPHALDGRPDPTAEIEFLRTQLATSTADVTSLRDELATTWAQLNATEQAREKSQTELAQTKTQLADASQPASSDELTEATQRLSAAQTQIKSLSEEVTSARRAQGRLQAQLAESSQAERSVQAELKTLSTTRNHQSDQLKDAQARIEQLQLVAGEQNTNQATALTQLRQELAETQTRSATETQQYAQLETTLNESHQRHAQLQQRLTLSKAEVATLATDLATSRANLAQSRRATTTTENSSNAVHEELTTTRETLAAVSQQRDQLQANLADQANATDDRTPALTAEIAQLRGQLTARTNENQALRTNLAQAAAATDNLIVAQDEITQLDATLTTTRENLAAVSQQRDQLQATLADQANAPADRTPALETEITQLRQQLATRTSEANTLRANSAQAEAASDNLAVAKNKNAELVAKLVTDLATTQEKLTAVAQQRDQLQTVLTGQTTTPAPRTPALETEIAQLRQQLATRTSETNALRVKSVQAEAASANLAVSKNTNAKLVTDLATTQEKLTAVAQQRDQLQTVLTDQTTTPDPRTPALETEITQLRQQLATRTNEAESLRANLTQASTTADNLQVAQDEISRLDSELSAAREVTTQASAISAAAASSESEANQEKLADSLRAFAAIEAELRASRQTLTEAENDAQADATTIANLESRLADLQPTLAAAQVAAANAESDVDSSTSALSETRLQLANTQTDLDRISREFAAFRESHGEQFTINDALASQNADLSTQVRQTQEQYAEASRELANIRTRYALSVSNNVPNSAAIRSTPGRPTPSLSANVRTHTVAAGDSLTLIAERYLGDAQRWPEIYAANRETLSSAEGVTRGMVLLIP